MRLASNLDHIEVFLPSPAVRTSPGQRNVFPQRTGLDPLVRPPRGFIVDEAADQTHVTLHRGRTVPGSICGSERFVALAVKNIEMSLNQRVADGLRIGGELQITLGNVSGVVNLVD